MRKSIAQQTNVYPNIARLRRVNGGYEVEAGDVLTGATIVIRREDWQIETLHRRLYVGPIALALLAAIAWRSRRRLPPLMAGAAAGVALAAPLGLAAGIVVHYEAYDLDAPPAGRGHVALDLAIVWILVGCVIGMSVQFARTSLRSLRSIYRRAS